MLEVQYMYCTVLGYGCVCVCVCVCVCDLCTYGLTIMFPCAFQKIEINFAVYTGHRACLYFLVKTFCNSCPYTESCSDNNNNVQYMHIQFETTDNLSI